MMYVIQCTLYSEYSTLYIVHCILVYNTPYNVRYGVQCTLPVISELYKVQKLIIDRGVLGCALITLLLRNVRVRRGDATVDLL